jgi:O-antigen/teichoic acid export membrane protein
MKTQGGIVRDGLYSLAFHLAPRFANVLLFILIGRISGPDGAGTFALATTYLLIVTTVTRGLDDLVVRQVSREPEQAASYLANFSILRIGTSLILYAGLFLTVTRLFDYSAETTQIVLIVSLSLLSDGLTYVAQSVLLGLRQFRLPASIITALNLIKLAIGAFILFSTGSLTQIAWIWLGASVLGMVMMVAVAFANTGGFYIHNWTSLRLAHAHRRVALTFAAITTLTAIESQIDTLILSGAHNEQEVGWYNAATTIVFTFVMFSQAYRFAVYPVMSRYAQTSRDDLLDLYQASIRYLGILVMPAVVGLIIIAPQIVPLVYGDGFDPTVAMLQILAVILVFVFLNEPNTRMMLVNERQRRVTGFLVASATVNLALNLILTPNLGGTGAATARVISTGTYFLLIFSYVLRHLAPIARVVLSTLSRSVIAALIMGLALWPIMQWHWSLLMIIGITVYFVCLLLLKGISRQEIGLGLAKTGNLLSRSQNTP